MIFDFLRVHQRSKDPEAWRFLPFCCLFYVYQVNAVIS